MRRKIQKPLALLLAFAMMFCMVPAAGFAADNGDSEAAVERIAGQNRWETAALTAVEKYGTNDTVIIARGDDDGNFADGLAASYLAKVKDAPILLTNPNSLPDATEKAIKDLNAQNAIVLGGELAVSEAVVNELEGLELEVERIEGGDRFGTAAAIAKAGGNADTALVVSGYAPADSLVAGPVAFNNDYPVLLVQKDSVPPATEDAIEELGIDNILVVGGETVISDAVYNALDADDRYAGYTRIDTSVVVADELFEEPETFTIVGRQDKNLADAVGAAVLGNPILYVGNDISDIEEYLNEVITADTQFVILGGTNAVNEAVENALNELAPEEEGLVVESVSAINLYTIEVKFNKEVDDTTLANTDITIDGNSVNGVQLGADKKTVIATVNTPLTNGTNYRVVVDGIQTVDGKDFPKYDGVILVKDTVAPTVSSVEYVKAANQVTVKFSEKLTDVGTITLTDKNGVTTTVSPSFSSGDDQVVIDTSALEDGAYTLTIVGATDLAGNYFANNKVVLNFTVGSDDTVKPTVTSVKPLSKNLVEVTFSEKLYSAGTVTLNGGSPLTLTEDNALDDAGDYKVDSTGKVYTINVGSLTNDAFNSLAFAGQVDLAGNQIDPVTKTFAYLDNVAPQLVETKVVGSKVYLTFNETVQLSGTQTAKLIEPNQVVKTIATGDISVNPNNNKQVIVDLAGYVSTVQSGSYSLEFAKDNITDLDNNSSSYKTTFKLTSSADTVKPEVIDANGAGTNGNILYNNTDGTVTVQYSEPMGSSAINVDNYTVDGVKVFESAYFDGDTTKVVLKLKDGVFSSTANRLFKIQNVKDAAGNLLKDDTYTETIQFVENVKPALLSAVLSADGTKVTFTFSEPLDDATIGTTEATGAPDFQVLVDGVVKPYTNEAVVSGSNGTKYEIEFGTPLTPSEVSKTITLKPVDSIDVKDKAGNTLTAFTTFTVTK